MSEHLHEGGHRMRHARVFLVIVFACQRLADAAVIWFTFLPENTVGLLRGVAVGSCLWTAVLLIGVWRKLRWARYALTTLNWGFMTLFGFWALHVWDDMRQPNPSLALIAGVVLYGVANTLLLRSRRLRHYANL
jgi:hypothetical protein